MAYTLTPPQEQPQRGGYVLTPPEEPQQRSTGEDLARGTGLGMRALVNGVLSLPTLPVNIGIGIGNMINRGTNALGLTNAAEYPMVSADPLMDALGIAKPENAAERVASDAMSLATGGGAAAKGAEYVAKVAAPGATKEIAALMSQGPTMQAVSGATAGLAGGTAREEGAPPWLETLASFAGGLAPSALQAAGASTVRGTVRGGEAGRQNYADRLKTFEDAGTTPSVGQASGNRAIQSAESGLSQVSASAGVMDRAAEREARDMGAKVESLADQIIPKANATKAGLSIERGIKNFVQRFRGEQKFLYDKLDNFIPPDSQVSVANVAAKLDELSAPIAGAQNISEVMVNPTITKMRDLLKADAANGTVPYQAIKELRTMIGEKIANPSLTDDIGTARWRQIYGALSDDMGAAAQAAGPQAERAFNRANAFTAAGHQRLEDVLQRVSGKDTAEKIFQAATNPSEMRQGATTVGTVMKSLEPEERKAVTAAVVRRLGLANPGQQNDMGEVFSSQTFLTNWNKISPEAKSHLFADTDLRKSLDQVAAASDMIKKGSKVFANPSGTAPAINNQMTGFSLAGAALTGRPEVFTGIVAGLVGANISARLLTKPEFVRWLAKTTTMPPALIPAQVNTFAQHVNRSWSQQDRDEFNKYLNGIEQSASGSVQQP